MRIGLIGYGKLNKAIEHIAVQQGHTIVFKADSKMPKAEWTEQLKLIDIAIENTHPEAVEDNLLTCIQHQTPVVTGTTGWQNRLEFVSEQCIEHNSALFYSSNFSVGVYITSMVNTFLAGIMKTQPEYHVKLQEWHHVHKKDAPSGTAIALANEIIAQHSDYSSWKLGNTMVNTELPIESFREGEVTGKHCIEWKSEHDTIRLEHEAHSREGFAAGALLAASFLMNKKGIFTMKHLFSTFEPWK